MDEYYTMLEQQPGYIMSITAALKEFASSISADTVRGWIDNEIFTASSAQEAGKKFSDAFVSEFYNQMIGSFMNVISQIIFQGVVQPMLMAGQGTAMQMQAGGAMAGSQLQTGATTAASMITTGGVLTASALQGVVEQVRNTLSIMTQVLNDESIQVAMKEAQAVMQTMGEDIFMAVETSPAAEYIIDYGDAVTETSDAVQDATETMAQAANDLRDRLKKVATDITDFLNDLLMGEDSILSWNDKFTEAKKAYERTLEATMSGDIVAAEQLTEVADQYMKLAREGYASGQAYVDVFKTVNSDLDNVRTGIGNVLTLDDATLTRIIKTDTEFNPSVADNNKPAVLQNVTNNVVTLPPTTQSTVKTAEELGRPSANAMYASSGFSDGSGDIATPEWQKNLYNNMPRFAEGGIVNEPTVGLFGEAGPEAIVPLNEKNVPEIDNSEAQEIQALRQEIRDLHKTIAENDAYTQEILKAMIERDADNTDREIDAISKAGKGRGNIDRK
jgi:hypothetical protein